MPTSLRLLVLLGAPVLATAGHAIAADETDVTHYDLDVLVEDERLVVTTDVWLARKGAPRKLEMELASAMDVVAVRSGEREVPFQREGWSLRVDMSACRRDGDAIMFRVRCAGRPYNKQSNGLVRTTVTPEITYIRSQYAWYPRVADDPATYRTTVTAREEHVAHTAGRPVEAPVSEGRHTTTFVQSTPIRSAGLVVGPYETVEAGGLTALVLGEHGRGARHLLGVAARALEHYGERWGPVPHDDFVIVEMPATFGAGSGYGEAGYVLLGSGAFEQAAGAPWADATVAHEVAHLWWGQAVSFRHFAHESLATWAAHGFTEQDVGPAVARQQRLSAVASVQRAEAAGMGLPLTRIREYGRGLPPGSYRAHAYDKGLMLLVMLADVVGVEALDDALRAFLEEHEGELVDYTVLRDALVRASPAARAVLDQWEPPGMPTLSVHDVEHAGGRVRGKLSQDNVAEPYSCRVELEAIGDGAAASATVQLTKGSARFSIEPVPRGFQDVVIDPSYRLLARRPTASASDLDAALKSAFQVVNAPGLRDEKRLRATISALEGIVARGAGEHEGLCHTGIGRCRFRLGEHDEAATALRTALALGPGGPFHARWIHLRLGNIADLAGRRDEARARYERVLAHGKDDHQTKRARAFLERPYRGLDEDG